MRIARQAFMGLGYLFVLGVLIQVFLAGLGMFGEADEDFDPHRLLGNLLHLPPILMFIAAIVGRMKLPFIGLTVLLFVLVSIQFPLVEAEGRFVQALHPANAIVMFALGHFLAQRATRLVKGETVFGATPA